MVDKSFERLQRRIKQHVRYGLTPLPFGTLILLVAMLYMLLPLAEINHLKGGRQNEEIY